MWKFLLVLFFLVRAVFALECRKYWIEADYLLWRIKNNPLPIPLVTSASLSDPIPGAIGEPNTHILLGNSSIDMGWMQGFQVEAGVWIRKYTGIEGRYFLLPSVSTSKSLSTSGMPGSPNYAVPIFDVSGVFGLNGIPGETIFILPGPLGAEPGFAGTFTLQLESHLQGAELNYMRQMMHTNRFQLTCLGGFWWIELKEKLRFEVDSHSIPGSPVGSAFYNTIDRFDTTNHFLAGQLNLNAFYQTTKWHIEALLKGGLGATLQEIDIQGSSQTNSGNVFFLTSGTGGDILPGGIFAEPSNSGVHRKNRFAVGFEAKFRTGLRMTPHLDINLGYTFLWISRLLRPGDQLDRKINSTLTALADASRATVGIGPGPIPFGTPGAAPLPSGPTRPKPLFKMSSFWAQGLDVGIQINF